MKVEDIANSVKTCLDPNYKAVKLNGIPTISNIHFGKKVYTRRLTTFSIDLRRSTQLLFDHDRTDVAKIHKAFLTGATRVIERHGGKVRDFQGDSILAFWEASPSHISDAVKTALGIRWLISIKLKKEFKKYEDQLKYVIGIDTGDVSIARVGVKGNVDYNGLIYIGESVNFAVAMANDRKNSPKIMISAEVYKKLNKKLKSGGARNNNLWKGGSLTWNGKRRSIMYSKGYEAFK